MSADALEMVRPYYPDSGVDMVRMFEHPARAKAFWEPRTHPDFRSTSDPDGPGPVGREGGAVDVAGIDSFVAGWHDLVSPFESLMMYGRDFVALSEGRVFVETEFVARTRTGGVDLTLRGGIIWTFEDDLVRELEAWFDPARARRAAGLAD